MNPINLKYIKVEHNDNNQETVLLNNGEDTLEVPEIIKHLIPKFDGEHDVKTITEEFEKEYGVEIDVEDFINQLKENDFLQDKNRYLSPINITIGKLYNKLFLSKKFFLLEIIFFVISFYLVCKNVSNYFNFNYLFLSNNLTISVFIYFFLVWGLVLEHELCHYYSSAGFKIPAIISLGSRLQFLVVQTTILNPYALRKKQRVEVYITGILTDLFICELCTIFIFLNINNQLNDLLRCILYIKSTAIIWQFLIYMKTDVYYIVTTMFNEKNLMQEAQLYLKNKNKSTKRIVKNYSYLLISGRLISFIYFSSFQLPLILISVKKIYISGITIDSIVTSVILLSSWVVLMFLFVERMVKKYFFKN